MDGTTLQLIGLFVPTWSALAIIYYKVGNIEGQLEELNGHVRQGS